MKKLLVILSIPFLLISCKKEEVKPIEIKKVKIEVTMDISSNVYYRESDNKGLVNGYDSYASYSSIRKDTTYTFYAISGDYITITIVPTFDLIKKPSTLKINGVITETHLDPYCDQVVDFEGFVY